MIQTASEYFEKVFDAGDLFLMSLPYCNSSLESCLAVLTDLLFISEYQILCIVFWYPRNMLSYIHVFVAVGLVLGFFAVMLAPKVMRLPRPGICPKYAWIEDILIMLWYVQLYSHMACMIASAQNLVLGFTDYNIHLIVFLLSSVGLFNYSIL